MAEKNYPIEVFILFSSRRHGGRTRRLCGADLHGCAVGLQNRTRRHDAPHAAEQTAAPMCISDLCRSSTINSPPTGGIGVRVLPASCVLVPKRYACARRRGLRCFATTFYAAHQKVISHPLRRSSFPKCKQFLGLHFGFLFSRYNSRYGIPKDWFLPFVVATIVATQRPVPIPAAFWQDPRTRR